MLNRFKKVIDLNKTVRHISYREMRQRWERQERQSETLFRWIITITVIVVTISFMWK